MYNLIGDGMYQKGRFFTVTYDKDPENSDRNLIRPVEFCLVKSAKFVLYLCVSFLRVLLTTLETQFRIWSAQSNFVS